MQTNADAFFTIGKTHMICQDYARAGRAKNGNAYAVVCDGCSSSPDTDFGARLLAIAAEIQLQSGLMPEIDRTIEMLKINLDWVGLKGYCFDATMVAALLEEGQIRVRMWGDGVIVGKRRNGQLLIHSVEHTKGAPHYVSYHLDEDRFQGYLAKFGNAYRILTLDQALKGQDDIAYWNTQVGVEAPFADWKFDTSEFELVALMSDGASSFQCVASTSTSRSSMAVPLEEVVPDLLQIKSTTGEFVRRTVHKFLNKACPTRNWFHTDDLAVAALWVENETP